MDNIGVYVNRYVATPYSYYGDTSRARSWSVWDRKENGFRGKMVRLLPVSSTPSEAAEAMNKKA